MEHRDLIKDEIEKLTQALGSIFSGFMGLKAAGKMEQAVEVSKGQLKTELDIDLELLFTFSKLDILAYLRRKKWTYGHYKTLSMYLKEIGEHELQNDKAKAKIYLTKALELLELESEVSNTISFEALRLKSDIESLLEQCL